MLSKLGEHESILSMIADGYMQSMKFIKLVLFKDIYPLSLTCNINNILTIHPV